MLNNDNLLIMVGLTIAGNSYENPLQYLFSNVCTGTISAFSELNILLNIRICIYYSFI